jgi:LacI family transcriptional regulator
MSEVGRRAGVSAATVARVIYSNGYVGGETRERVQSAIRATGYRPNIVARGLRTQRSFTIGHVISEITRNPFFVHVARSLESEAFRVGYKMFLFNHRESAEDEKVGVERFVERRVDAVIFNHAVDAANLEILRDAGIPVIEIEREAATDTHAIAFDTRAGVLEGMRHLIELGHRRIAFIGGDPSLYARSAVRPRSVEEERVDAYRGALREAGLPVDEELIGLGLYYRIDDGSNIEGYREMRRLLALGDPPTAVFTSCDTIASGALRAIYTARLRVPDDISVVGFDDTLAQMLTPPLTSVAQPLAELGSHALRIALAAIEDGTLERQTVTLTPKLVVRESTGPVPTSRGAGLVSSKR